jgi:hypothetical protein
MSNESRLGAKRWNRLEDHALKWVERRIEMAKDALMADGYPPFTEPLPPMAQYQRLAAMRSMGDPAFFNDPEAAATLAKLEGQFGPAVGGPLGQPGPYPGGM